MLLPFNRDLTTDIYSCVKYSLQAFSSDGRWLISSSIDSTVKTWDLPSGKYDFLLSVSFFL